MTATLLKREWTKDPETGYAVQHEIWSDGQIWVVNEFNPKRGFASKPRPEFNAAPDRTSDQASSVEELVDRISLLESLLEEAESLLSAHHDSELCTWFGRCPVCSKKGTEFYPNNIFGRIESALSVNAQSRRTDEGGSAQ